MAERSLFAIIYLLQGAKSLCTLYGVWVIGFNKKNLQILEKNHFHFITFKFFLLLLLHKP